MNTIIYFENIKTGQTVEINLKDLFKDYAYLYTSAIHPYWIESIKNIISFTGNFFLNKEVNEDYKYYGKKNEGILDIINFWEVEFGKEESSIEDMIDLKNNLKELTKVFLYFIKQSFSFKSLVRIKLLNKEDDLNVFYQESIFYFKDFSNYKEILKDNCLLKTAFNIVSDKYIKMVNGEYLNIVENVAVVYDESYVKLKNSSAGHQDEFMNNLMRCLLFF